MKVEEKVKDILSELSTEAIIENNAKLQDDLALDSFSLVMLLVEIEDAFEIELDESDMNPFDFDTVQSVINLVNKYCGDENA